MRAKLRRTVSILAAAAVAVALSACGHRELKAPCADGSPAVSSLFSSIAYASDVTCGPMVRQSGVTIM